jgi:hypothetical protein
LGGEMGKLRAFGGCGGHEFILILLWLGGLRRGISILGDEPYAKSCFSRWQNLLISERGRDDEF